jgi:hypothetical protein
MRVGVRIEAKSWGAGGEEVGKVVGAGGGGVHARGGCQIFFPNFVLLKKEVEIAWSVFG